MMPCFIHTDGRVVRRLLALIALVLIASGGAAFWWLHQPLVTGSEPLELAIEPGTTPRSLLQKLVRGEESLRAITLVEGWNWRQVRQALAKEDQLKRDVATLTDEALMAQLGRPGVPPEGRFFPDTYTYAKGSSDIAVLRRAMNAMDRRLEAAWAQRS